MKTPRARKMDWILSAFLAVALAMAGWILKQVYELHADVDTLKAQVGILLNTRR